MFSTREKPGDGLVVHIKLYYFKKIVLLLNFNSVWGSFRNTAAWKSLFRGFQLAQPISVTSQPPRRLRSRNDHRVKTKGPTWTKEAPESVLRPSLRKLSLCSDFLGEAPALFHRVKRRPWRPGNQ